MNFLRILLCVLVLCFFGKTPGQVYFTNVKAQAANPYQAFISWTIAAGSTTCSGIEVQTSLDSFANYSSIYTVPGICGGSSSDQSYDYTHNNPDIHKKNYYRIYAPTGGYSPIVMVDFGAINGEYNIYPDPISDATVLTFDNPNSDPMILDIVNAKGYRLFYIPYITTTQFNLPKSWFEGGMYYFRLINPSGGIIRGKFIVIE
ncbi:MAG: hypothetical protein IAF38_12490 [Bacteroidia bacterium]|nr:hypothetical protein [Bacteroidia bacterium]